MRLQDYQFAQFMSQSDTIADINAPSFLKKLVCYVD